MTRERMSRPSSSVPIQWAALGGCSRSGRSMLLGLCGAIHGANRAKITNTATSAMPIEASTLRRPSVTAVVQVEEAIRSQVNHKGRELTTKSTKEHKAEIAKNTRVSKCQSRKLKSITTRN